jgi:hypothetical protein
MWAVFNCSAIFIVIIAVAVGPEEAAAPFIAENNTDESSIGLLVILKLFQLRQISQM